MPPDVRKGCAFSVSYPKVLRLRRALKDEAQPQRILKMLTARQSRRRTSGGTAAKEQSSRKDFLKAQKYLQSYPIQTRSSDLRGRKNAENSCPFVRNEHDCLSSEDANLSPRLPFRFWILDFGFWIDS